MNRMRTALQGLLPFAAIFAAALLVYLPSLSGGLLMDDDGHITRPELRSLAGLARIWFEVGATAHYYPMLNTAFWIEYWIGGDTPSFYRVLNILQHVGSAWLVVLLMRQLGLRGAFLGGLLFALHPVQVDSVAWISEQKNTLSTLFGLAAAVLYLRFDRDRDWLMYASASFLFLAALLTKTVTAVIPPALLVVFWWQRGSLQFRRDVAPLLPWFAVGAGLGLFSAWFEQAHSHAQGPQFSLSWIERVLIAGRAIVFYARSILWPADLLYISPRWSPNAAELSQYLYVSAVIGVGLTLLCLVRRWRGPLAVFLLFTGMLFPVLGFLNINWFLFSYVADHFQYLPGIALLVPLAAGLGNWMRAGRGGWRRAGFGLTALLCTTWAILTYQRSAVYASAETLYRDTVKRNPEAWVAHHNLAVILLEKPARLDEALQHLRETLRLFPDHARAHNNYANALMLRGQTAEALAHYRRSIELQGRVPEVHLNYALALNTRGAPVDEIVAALNTALSLKPDYLEARLSLAEVLAGCSGAEAAAETEYRKALRLEPGRAATHRDLGTHLMRLPGRETEAVESLREAVRLDPRDASAYANLGAALAPFQASREEALNLLGAAVKLNDRDANAHFNLGLLLSADPARVSEACRHLQAAASAEPEDVLLRANIAGVLARLPNQQHEVALHLEAVVRMEPASAPARARLGAVLADLPGRRGEAIVQLKRALELDPANESALSLLKKLAQQP